MPTVLLLRRIANRFEGIHWPGSDEDISVLGLLAGCAGATRRAAAE